MFSNASEKKIRYVRGILALLWAVLILSLFWDPITHNLNKADNEASPFRIRSTPAYIQGKPIPENPEGYQMGARIFWTMLVPIVPFFLLFFGHEAWRRICPLSFMTQIPQYLGLQAKKKEFNRRTGMVEKNLRLVKVESWLARNYWFVQFTFLYVGISARLVFINSDRLALAAFLLMIIAMAIAVGFLFGGKTWCNYLCPISPVQKIYTEPRGLLESEAHHGQSMVTQSMCRTFTEKDKDQGACVGCISNCPDIDLERNHWETLFNPGRKAFYYGYFGLVLGFYTYYYIYSCNWDYYFSGAWTHEPSQVAQLFDPGFCYNDKGFGIPKIFAAPLTLAGFILASIGIFTTYEKIYVQIKKWIKRPVSKVRARHHTFMVAAFSTFNTFYFFGGRPNLNLLPPLALAAVDITIIFVSTVWFYRNLMRDQRTYKRESLVSSLKRQLKKLQFNFKRILEGRDLDELNTDEVYILAKTLPGFTNAQKLQVYKDIVRENLTSGKTDASSSLSALKEVRQQMELSDEDHRQILDEVQVEMSSLLEWQKNTTQAHWMRLNNYRNALEGILVRLLDANLPVQEALARDDIQKEIDILQSAHSITPEEHEELISVMLGDDELLLKQALELVESLKTETAKYYSLSLKVDKPKQAYLALLRSFFQTKRKSVCLQLLNILASLEESDDAFVLAHSLSNIASEEVKEILETGGRLVQGMNTPWQELLSKSIFEVLTHRTPELASRETSIIKKRNLNPKVLRLVTAKEIKNEMPDPLTILEEIIRSGVPVPRATALFTLGKLHKQKARSMANSLNLKPDELHWLVREVVEKQLGINLQFNDQTDMILKIEVADGSRPYLTRSFQKSRVTIGRDRSNDIILSSQAVSAHHATIEKSASGYQVMPSQTVIVKEEKFKGAPIELDQNASFTVGPFHLQTSWMKSDLEKGSGERQDYHLVEADTMTTMLHLFRSKFFNHLSPDVLAELAKSAEVRIYRKQGTICRRGESSDKIFVVGAGKVQVNVENKVLDEVTAGSSIGEMGIFTNRPRSTDVIAVEDKTMMISIDGSDLMAVVEDNSKVATSFLKILSARQQQILSRISA